MFDVLVNLDENGKIDLEYHFDDSMNTHVIDSINGEQNWWYRTWYSGGWSERNSFRMDHYPWKPQTNLYFFKASMARIDDIHSVFADEVTRKNENGGENRSQTAKNSR